MVKGHLTGCGLRSPHVFSLVFISYLKDNLNKKNSVPVSIHFLVCFFVSNLVSVFIHEWGERLQPWLLDIFSTLFYTVHIMYYGVSISGRHFPP